jgi:hypothetical protein
LAVPGDIGLDLRFELGDTTVLLLLLGKGNTCAMRTSPVERRIGNTYVIESYVESLFDVAMCLAHVDRRLARLSLTYREGMTKSYVGRERSTWLQVRGSVGHEAKMT